MIFAAGDVAKASELNKLRSQHYQSTATVGNVGAGEDSLYSQAIAAGTLGRDGDRLWINISGNFAANGNTKRVRVKFGAVTFVDVAGAINGGAWRVTAEIVRLSATTQRIAYFYAHNTGPGIAIDIGSAAETLSGAVTLAVTGEATSTDDIRVQLVSVEFVGAP